MDGGCSRYKMQWHIQNPLSKVSPCFFWLSFISIISKEKKWTTCLYNHHRTRGAPAPFCLSPPSESPETPLIISPVFALRPHGQASKTSGQIGVYECKHPACHTVSVSERVDVDKKQLDGDSQSSQTPRRHGFWSSLPSYGLCLRKQERKKNNNRWGIVIMPYDMMTCTLLSFEFFFPISLTPHTPIPLHIHGCSSVVVPFAEKAHTEGVWRGIL